MKALVVVAALLVTIGSAHAECKSYTNSGNPKITLTMTDQGATVTGPRGHRELVQMVGGTQPSGFGLYNPKKPDDEFYAVFFGGKEDDLDSTLKSPGLAKLTGGSATFVRKCK